MKNSIKSITLPFLFALAIVLGACDKKSTTGENTSDTTAVASAEEGEHKHAYRCPMNCEKGKTYDQPGKCPVCGMELEHYDEGSDNGLSYQMVLKTTPETLEASKSGLLSFTPKVKGNDAEAVPLDVMHEKKIHLIIVSNDLSYFDHIHPDYQSSGSYDIKVLGKDEKYSSVAGVNETRFENGGDYFLFADYQPSGGAHQVEKIALKVNGPSKAEAKFNAEKLSGKAGDYTVTLNADGGKFVTKSEMHIAGAVTKNGKAVDVNTLENYLGAKAHMVVISLNEKEYLHVHPEVTEGKFDLHTTFKAPGIYRGWIQFKAEGEVRTVDFTLDVKEGTGEEKPAHAGGEHSH